MPVVMWLLDIGLWQNPTHGRLTANPSGLVGFEIGFFRRTELDIVIASIIGRTCPMNECPVASR